MFNHNFSVMGVNKNQTVKAGFAGFVLVAVVVVFFAMFSIERIDSGQTGIIVNLAGSERGIDDAKVETGWVMYNRFAKQLFEYPAFAQIVDYEPFDIQDKREPFLRPILPLSITSSVRMPSWFSYAIARLRRSWNSLLSLPK